MYNKLRKEFNLRNANVERYYPDVISNAKELKSLSKTIDKELDIWIDRVKERYEQMLFITPKINSSIQDRQQQILAKINAQLPYTERSFQKMLNATFGSGKVTVSVDYNNYAQWLSVTPGTQIDNEFLTTYARQITPANLTINLRTDNYVETKIYHGAKSLIYEKIVIGG